MGAHSTAALLASPNAPNPTGSESHVESLPSSPTPHALERWARAVHAVIEAPADTRTLRCWARLIGASETTLKSWCRRARCSPKDSLDFARVLRALAAAERGGSDQPIDFLDVADERTLHRLLVSSGLIAAHDADRGGSLRTRVLTNHTFDIDTFAVETLARLYPHG